MRLHTHARDGEGLGMRLHTHARDGEGLGMSKNARDGEGLGMRLHTHMLETLKAWELRYTHTLEMAKV